MVFIIVSRTLHKQWWRIIQDALYIIFNNLIYIIVNIIFYFIYLSINIYIFFSCFVHHPGSDFVILSGKQQLFLLHHLLFIFFFFSFIGRNPGNTPPPHLLPPPACETRLTRSCGRQCFECYGSRPGSFALSIWLIRRVPVKLRAAGAEPPDELMMSDRNTEFRPIINTFNKFIVSCCFRKIHLTAAPRFTASL